jgi:hypothetical protein
MVIKSNVGQKRKKATQNYDYQTVTGGTNEMNTYLY